MTQAATVTALPVKVGDVFSSSWGYDQTNVDWYAVTEVSKSGKTATFIQLSGSTVRDEGAYTDVVAGSAAICAGCLRSIRQLKKLDGSVIWRHLDTGQAICFAEYVSVVGGTGYWQSRRAKYQTSYDRGPDPVARPNVLKRRLRYASDGSVWANAHADYASMKRWDGKPKYQTGAGWGH